MRSIYLFPCLDVDEVTRLLGGLGEPNGSTRERVIAGCLYVRLVDPPYWGDWQPEDVRTIEACFGRRPEVMIEVDISGRIPGHAEVYDLCAMVLREGGVASDDFSDCWSLSEILDSNRNGRRFFETSP